MSCVRNCSREKQRRRKDDTPGYDARPWRGGDQFFARVEDDAAHEARGQGKVPRGWNIAGLQELDELKKQEKALPPMAGHTLKRAGMSFKVNAGVVVFHPRIPWDWSDKLCEEMVKSGKWPSRASTTIFFHIPKNVTSERPVALFTTIIRWWEWLKSPAVVDWSNDRIVRVGCVLQKSWWCGSGGVGSVARNGKLGS